MQTMYLAKIVVSMLMVTFIVVAQTPPVTKDPPLLSQTDPGYAFVEEIQKTYCNKRPSEACRFDFERCKQIHVKLWRDMFDEPPSPDTLRKSCDRVSTQFELPGSYSLLNGLYSEVREVAPEVGLAKLDKVYLGSLPIRQVNARVLSPDPTLGHFLFFNQGFFVFVNELAKVAALSIPMKVENNRLVIDGSREALDKKVATDTEIRFLFINRLMHFLEVESLKPASPPSDIQPILSRYQQGIELFAMAHEYSHIALKHTGGTQALEGMDVSAAALGISGPSGDWAQELEADFYASKMFKRISMRRVSGKDPHMADYMLIATPEFYFLARRILNEAYDIFFNDKQVHTLSEEEPRLLKVAIDCTRKTTCQLIDVFSKQVGVPRKHPDSTIRREFARVLLEDNDNSKDETKEAMTALAGQMIRNIDYLWKSVSTKLRSPEAAGVIQQVRDKRAKSQ